MTSLATPSSAVQIPANTSQSLEYREPTDLRPRLKQGVFVISRVESTYVGRMNSGVEIFSEVRIAVAAMDGSLTCAEIADLHQLEIARLHELVKVLDDAHLLDTHTSKIAVHSRFHSSNVNRASHASDDSNDGAYQQLQAKLLPELAFATWLPQVRDGGVGAVSARRNLTVEIHGDSRIAVLIFGILLASGVSSTRAVIKDSRTISETDLAANFLSTTDIGLSIQERLAECARDLSLFPATASSAAPENKVIAVSVGPVQAERVQEWLSRDIAHLFIDNPDGAAITIGPLVIPGKSPCLRCVSMSRDENNEAWKEVSWHLATSVASEVPVSIAHHVAGLAALEILHFIDTGTSTLIGASHRVDYHNPRGSERNIFTRHPGCGCNW